MSEATLVMKAMVPYLRFALALAVLYVVYDLFACDSRNGRMGNGPGAGYTLVKMRGIWIPDPWIDSGWMGQVRNFGLAEAPATYGY